MKDVIYFSVPGSAAIHELKLGLTLVRFIGFDMRRFEEQCAEAIVKARDAGRGALERGRALVEYIRGCHPYCGALIATEFSDVFLDCAIGRICLQDGVGLEELWVRTMSAKGEFERAVFARITDYKTGHAINQWTNLLRMQAYAAEKAAFIYCGESDVDAHRARKLYFDMAFAMAARALGFGSDDMPRVRCVSVPHLPQAAEMLSNLSSSLARVVGSLAPAPPAGARKNGRDCVGDQIAGIVARTIAGLGRPGDGETRQIAQKYSDLPETVYLPSGLKAVIDLEFDKLMEAGFYLLPDGQGGYQRLRYPARKSAAEKGAADFQQPAAEAVEGLMPKRGAQGRRSHRPPDGREAGRTASDPGGKAGPAPGGKKAPVDEGKAPEGAEHEGGEDSSGDAPGSSSEAGAAFSGKVRKIIAMASDPRRKPSKPRTLQEINARCNLIWTSMNFREGWDVTAEETSEWFRYLTKLRYGIGTGELQPEELDKFLDATLEVFRLLPGEEK